MERIVAQISPEDLKLDAEQFTHMLTCWEVRWLSLDVFFSSFSVNNIDYRVLLE